MDSCRRDPGALSVTTERGRLGAGKTPAGTAQILWGEAQEARGRIVELQAGAPFDADLEWSAGQGIGNRARVSVPRATRVYVFARTLKVVVANQRSQPQDVNLAVSDGFAPTQNFLEESSVGDDTWKAFEVPAFGLSVRPDLESPANLPSSFLRVKNGFGSVTALLNFGAIAGGELPLGLATAVEVLVPSLATSGNPPGFRLVYRLGL